MTTTDQQDPREVKLPRWAQDLLASERLRRRGAESALQAYATAAGNPEDSDAILEPYADQPIGLGDLPTVAFRLRPAGSSASGLVSIRLSGDRTQLNVLASDEIVTRQQWVNSLSIVPWPGAWR